MCFGGNTAAKTTGRSRNSVLPNKPPHTAVLFATLRLGLLGNMVRVFVAIVLLMLPAAAFAQTEKRIALLIGNKD